MPFNTNMTDYTQKYSKGYTPIITRKDGTTVHSRYLSFNKAVEQTEQPNVLKFVITDETVDRYGDIVRANGGVYDNYLNNPIVLMHHISHGGDLPVAKCINLEVVELKVIATVEFDTDEISQEVLRKIKGGFLNCVSIGFCPIEYEENKETRGMIFNTWELLEFSFVKIPANPNAGRVKHFKPGLPKESPKITLSLNFPPTRKLNLSFTKASK